MGILRSVLTPAPDEIDSVRKALDRRNTSEPVVREQRTLLSHSVPTWATRIDGNTEISTAALDDLDTAIRDRLDLLKSYRPGERRDRAIARHEAAAKQIAAWRDELAGISQPDGKTGAHTKKSRNNNEYLSPAI